MKTITVQNKQNLFDISIQELGGIGGVFKIALANKISVTKVLSANLDLKIEEPVLSQTIASFFKNKTIKPATGNTLNIETLLTPKCGIGCMVIGNSFKIG